MKTYIDFFETYKGEFIGALKFRNKFIRIWGTETLDGVPVMKEQFTLYPGTLTDKNIQRMCKMLGMWNDIKAAKFDTIAGYYLWLNPDKSNTKQDELVRELMAEKVDEFCPKDVWKYSTINYIDKVDPNRFAGFTKEQILSYIDNDYRNIFSTDNGFVVGDTIEETAIGKYVLFDDGTEFEVEVVSSQITAVPVEVLTGRLIRETKQIRYTGLSVEIKYRRIANDINANGLFMDSIKAEQNEVRLAVLAELQASSTTDTDAVGGTWGQKVTTTDTVWYKDRLRVSAIRAVGIPAKTATLGILGFLDTGQIKKKVKWYKKVLGLVIIVIALIISYYTGNVGFTAAAIAWSMGTAILIMTLIQAKWGKSNGAAASYMGRWIKVANFISTVTGIGAAIKQAVWKKLAAMVVLKTVLKKASAEIKVLATVALSAIGSMSSPGGGFTLGEVITATKDYLIENWQSVGLKVMNAAVEMRQVDMNADLTAAQNYADELEEANDNTDSPVGDTVKHLDKTNHLAIIDTETYTDNLGRIQGRYDFDSEYGPTLSTMHTGNILVAKHYKATGLNLRAEDLV